MKFLLSKQIMENGLQLQNINYSEEMMLFFPTVL